MSSLPSKPDDWILRSLTTRGWFSEIVPVSYFFLVQIQICWNTKAKFVNHTTENPKHVLHELHSRNEKEELQYSLSELCDRIFGCMLHGTFVVQLLSMYLLYQIVWQLHFVF